jgi:hypothetical protein
MSSTETVFRAFVASATDVSEERAILEEVIQEFNVTWSQKFRVRIELLKWETHTCPSAGDYPQAVINRQIGEDYDLFIGIMWHRFGTSTQEFGSGTEEEFHRAWARFKEQPDSLDIMFYFKDAPVSPSQLDLAQVDSVRKFKAQLGKEGVYYWTFNEPPQFAEFVRLHLSRFVQNRASELSGSSAAITASERQVTQEDQESTAGEELGLLDYFELGNQYAKQSSDALERIAAAMSDYTAAMNRRTKQIEELNATGPPDVNASKKLAALTAEDMDLFVSRVKNELPIFVNSYRRALNCTTDAANLSVSDFIPKDDTSRAAKLADLNVLLTTLRTTETSIDGMQAGTTSFRDSVQRLPRLTVTLNKAKRNTVGVLNELLEQGKVAKQLNADATKLVEDLIARLG